MKQFLLLVILATLFSLLGCKGNAQNPVIASMGFENYNGEVVTELSDNAISIVSKTGEMRVYEGKGKSTPNSLHIMGGTGEIEITNNSGTPAIYIGFSAERWTNREPFEFRIENFDGNDWVEIYNGDHEIKTGNFPASILLPIPATDSENQRLRFRSTTNKDGGVLIDDLSFFSDADMIIDSVVVKPTVFPILKRKEFNPVMNVQVFASGMKGNVELNQLKIETQATDQVVSDVTVWYLGSSTIPSEKVQFGSSQSPQKIMTFEGAQLLSHGANNFMVTYTLEDGADINKEVAAKCLEVKIDGKTHNALQSEDFVGGHLGIALRKHRDEGVHTYRIPGLATTNNGTLIAVYDIRYNNAADLQEDVDVGMQRSTDGGQSWKPMQIIMDMEEWGGLPDDQNGIGDPSVLVDRNTNTIWVAGVWAHGHPGDRNWWASRPGLEPEQTSQFVLVKSEDDGLTWSEPINITKQIKQKEWHLLLQGPGKGITLNDGTLVFPAQFKDEKEMPYSTIIYSKDRGESWHIGIGAKSNTTEAQVIELDDGGLMLNMRDNRNGSDKSDTNGRAVAVTYDLGKTWTTHSTSNGALPEPTCMASIIKEKFVVNGEKRNLVLFSNPNSKYGRHHMTIKASFDDGESWPVKSQKLIDSGSGAGYSCMTKIDDEHVGILYEGSQANLIFQIFSIDEIIE